MRLWRGTAALAALVCLVATLGCSERVTDGAGRSPHGADWSDPSADGFHGAAVAAVGDSACFSCHGDDLGGGISGLACSECHGSPHDSSWSDPLADGFHGSSVWASGYAPCLPCHGSDLGGGTSGVACGDCHAVSPLNCNFCHGDRAAHADSAFAWAPPADLAGAATTDSVTVGAHQAHLHDLSLRVPLVCADCHRQPALVDDPDHLDGTLPAEIVFGDLARSDDAEPSWDRSAATCTAVYCHGEFEEGDSGGAIGWTAVGQGAADCGTCHGVGEDEPHSGASEGCACHGSVVSYQDGVYSITDKTKHVNGEIEY